MDRETVEEIKRHFGVVVEGLDSTIRLLAEGVNARIDGLDARIDGLDARIDGLDARIDGLDARIQRLDAKIDTVDRKVDGLAQIVQLTYSELTGRLNDHETRIGALEHRQL